MWSYSLQKKICASKNFNLYEVIFLFSCCRNEIIPEFYVSLQIFG